jgi:hypothetical protein
MWVQSVIIGVQAVIIGVQAWIAYRQTPIMKKSTDVAEDNFLATHRPLIRVKHLFLESNIWFGSEPIVAALVFANVGSTNANIIGIRGGCGIVPRDDALPARPRLSEPSFVPPSDLATILAGRSVEIPDNYFHDPLSKSEIAAIRDKSATLYCFGSVEYQDRHGQGRVRTTNYCYRLAFPRNGATNNVRFRAYHDPDYEYQD